MRIQTVVLGCALLVVCVVQYNDAVPCSDTVTTNCTDCDDPANAQDVDCVATTTEAPTTVAGDTTTVATGTTTTATVTTTTPGSTPRRRLLRRIRILQRRLRQCRRNAANQRASLIKQIKNLTANSNNFKNKFFG